MRRESGRAPLCHAFQFVHFGHLSEWFRFTALHAAAASHRVCLCNSGSYGCRLNHPRAGRARSAPEGSGKLGAARRFPGSRYHSRSVKSLRHPFFVALLSALLLFAQQGRLLHEREHGPAQFDESSQGERQHKQSSHAQLCKLCLSFHALDALAVGAMPAVLASSGSVEHGVEPLHGICAAAPAAYRSRAPPSFLA